MTSTSDAATPRRTELPSGIEERIVQALSHQVVPYPCEPTDSQRDACNRGIPTQPRRSSTMHYNVLPARS